MLDLHHQRSQGEEKVHTGTSWQEPAETPRPFQAGEAEDKGQGGHWFKVPNITEISGNAISFALSVTLLR